MFGYDFCLYNSLPHLLLLLRLQILMPDVHVILQPLVLSYFFQSYSLHYLLFLFSLSLAFFVVVQCLTSCYYYWLDSRNSDSFHC